METLQSQRPEDETTAVAGSLKQKKLPATGQSRRRAYHKGRNHYNTPQTKLKGVNTMSISEMDMKAESYFDLMAQIEELQAQAEAIRDDLKAVMVDRAEEELTGHGWRATWHNTTTSRFDSKAFKEQHKDLYEAFTVKGISTRFTMNRIKE